MKRTVALLLSLALMMPLVACSSEGQQASTSESPNASPESNMTMSTSNLTTLDAVKETALKDANDTVAALNAEYEQLAQEIDSYEKYLGSTDKIEAFYTKVVSTSENLGITLCDRSANYASLVLTSNASNDDKYDELDGIYDYIYEDAASVMYDDIYDGILDNMYDAFYDGILGDAYSNASYNEWSDARSDEYKRWSDARSDVYDAWTDCRSEIYGLWTDMRSEVFSGDLERAQKKLNDFKEDIATEKAA